MHEQGSRLTVYLDCLDQYMKVCAVGRLRGVGTSHQVKVEEIFFEVEYFDPYQAKKYIVPKAL